MYIGGFKLSSQAAAVTIAQITFCYLLFVQLTIDRYLQMPFSLRLFVLVLSGQRIRLKKTEDPVSNPSRV
jgi:hypothetical protein